MSDSKPQPTLPITPDTAPEARFEWTQSPFESFLEQHFKKMLIVLLAIATAVGAWLVIRQQRERAVIEQAEAFTGSETLDDYKKVIANHPGTVAAGSAQLMIANLLAQNNDLPGALDELKKFTSNFPQHPMVEHAAFRIAALTAEKDGSEAGVREYETFINRFPNSPLRPLAQMRKADALVNLGKTDDALAVFDAIQKDSSLFGNEILTEAKERADQVKLKPPTEVEFVPDPDPAPAATPSTGLDFDLPTAPESVVPPANSTAPEPTATPEAPATDPSAPTEPAPATPPAASDTTPPSTPEP
ncbi:MAG: tetratricopeptide repeat protein [Verrucomicrobiales bacterium]